MTRYAAHLMLEYGVRGVVRTQPMCERRIVVFRARNAQAAVRKAKQIGKKAEQRYRNVEGRIAETRFVGLVDVIDIDFVGPEEIYYSFGRVKNPRQHIRADSELSVISGWVNALQTGSFRNVVRPVNKSARRKTATRRGA